MCADTEIDRAIIEKRELELAKVQADLQLTSPVASSYASGFTFPNDIHSTRESMLNQIKVYLAGGLTEERSPTC